jgi:carbamoylphosphate synthase small subunit
MSDIGKGLVLLGAAICVIGAIVWTLGRAGFRGLPGDISYQGQNVRFYFPIVSCIVISIVLTLGMWLWRWLSGR